MRMYVIKERDDGLYDVHYVPPTFLQTLMLRLFNFDSMLLQVCSTFVS
jgi:hypothetical protein